MKTNNLVSGMGRWSRAVRKATQGFLAAIAFGGLLAAAPGQAHAGACIAHADCLNDPAGITCINGNCGTKLCMSHDDCNYAPLPAHPEDFAQHCDVASMTCKTDLKNGDVLPFDCMQPSDGSNVCYTEICYPADDMCGSPLHGLCYESEDCREGTCVKSPLLPSGLCLECKANADCAGNANGPICNTQTNECQTNCKDHTDCAADEWCDNPNLGSSYSGTCKPDLPNGTGPGSAIPPNVGGQCTDQIADIVCESGACDTSNDHCGVEIGHQGCENGNDAQCIGSVCKPGAPGQDGTCVECTTGKTGLCDASEICDVANSVCEPCTASDVSKCPAGKTMCNEATEPNECVECFTNNDCPSNKPECVAGTCSSQCTVDADCPGQWCDLTLSGGACRDKLDNGKPIPTSEPHSPTLDGKCTPEAAQTVCKSGACDPDGDICGILVTHPNCENDGQCIDSVCEEATTICQECLADKDCAGNPKGPYCGSVTKTCGECKSDADCKDPSAPNCDTGSATCKPSCAKDADCADSDWCDLNEGVGEGVCTSDKPNGVGVPTSANHTPDLDGKCTEEVGSLVCLSKVCSTQDDLCGHLPGESCPNGDAQCRSNACGSDAKCACTKDADCPGDGNTCDVGTGQCAVNSNGYIAGSGLSCTTSPSRNGSGDSPAGLGIALLFTAAAGELARRRAKRKNG